METPTETAATVPAWAAATPLGAEWLVDAHGCPAEVLRSLEALQAVFARLVSDLELHPLSDPVWHRFPGPGGITGLLALRESHLACHTFPELGYAAFSLYCCRPRAAWAWNERLAELLGAQRVDVRAVERRAH